VGLAAAAGDVTSQFALDANALSSLKEQAKNNPKAALSAASSQFEALFVQMLLKSMREASPQDGPLDSEASKSYTAMFDQQISQQLAKKGIGIAAMLSKQLATTLPPDASTAGDAAKSGAAKAAPAFVVPTAIKPGLPLKSSASSGTTDATSSLSSAAGSVAATIQGFVDKLRPYAEAVAQKLGVPAQYLIAQAGLETGWGKSLAKATDGSSSQNLFGIKATAGWQGAIATATTTEFTSGQAVKTTAQFRAYTSYADSLQDFAKLLQTSRRYAGALANSHDAGKYASSLQQAGYATDPHYAEKLTRAIQTVARYSPGGETGVTTQVAAAHVDKTRDLA
jgi:peptidoglycan hydrolase FlgJ